MRLLVFLLVLSLLFVGPVMGQGNLTYGTNSLGALTTSAPLAFYTFSGTAGDLVSIQVIGITVGLDPAVSLNSPTQQQLANNDNDSTTPGTTDARISISLPQTGAFTILVSSVTGTPGDFLLRLNGQTPPPTTALTDAPADANIVSDDPQVFSFSADATEIITLNVTTDTPGFGFRVTVRDANGAPVAIVSGSDVVSVSLPFPPGSATYTAEITLLDPTVTGQVLVFVGGPPAGAAPAPSVPSPAETEEAAPSVLPDGVCGVSPGQGPVNVRSGPGTNFDIIAQLQPSQVLEVTGRSNDWYQVSVPGTGTGWVAASVVFTTGDCSAVPIVEGGAPALQQPVETEEAGPPVQDLPTFTPTATTAQQQDQQQPTATYTPTATPSATATVPAPTAPPDANFNSPLTIPLDSTASVTDFVSYPDGDREDRVRWDISGMNPTSSLSGGRARLILAVSCFGTGTNEVTFFTGGQTYSCGQTIVDREVTADSRTGQVTITAVAGTGTYVQWVLTGTATRVS